MKCIFLHFFTSLDLQFLRLPLSIVHGRLGRSGREGTRLVCRVRSMRQGPQMSSTEVDHQGSPFGSGAVGEVGAPLSTALHCDALGDLL